MLVEFSVANYRSIRDTLVLSMETAAIKAKDPAVDAKNLILLPGTKTKQLLKLKALFGGNASGKSNVVKALAGMLNIMHYSFADQEILAKTIDPFRLDETHPDEPTFFEIVFLLDGKQYRYGFEATRQAIVSEWLFGPAKERETYYFTREGTDIHVNRERFPEGAMLLAERTENLLRPNGLAYTLLHTLNQPISIKIRQEIISWKVLEYDTAVNNSHGFRHHLASFLESKANKDRLVEFLRVADVAIKDIEVLHGNPPDFIFSKFVKNKSEKESFKFSDESQGTQKMTYLMLNLLETLDTGGLMVVDEFDAKLHPNLVLAFLHIFQRPDINILNSQLVLIAHDSNLMSLNLFRRDQIELIRRERDGNTTATPLVNYRLRNDKAIREDYLGGLYRGVPWLNQFEDVAKELIAHE